MRRRDNGQRVKKKNKKPHYTLPLTTVRVYMCCARVRTQERILCVPPCDLVRRRHSSSFVVVVVTVMRAGHMVPVASSIDNGDTRWWWTADVRAPDNDVTRVCVCQLRCIFCIYYYAFITVPPSSGINYTYNNVDLINKLYSTDHYWYCHFINDNYKYLIVKENGTVNE